MGDAAFAREKIFEPEDFGIGRLFFHVRDAIVVANAGTERIVLWNQCAETMFGYPQTEALELPLHALVPRELRDLHRAGLARYQRSGTGHLIDGDHPIELRGVHKNGHEVPVELTLTKIPQRTAEGDRFALAIIRDISDRKRAEKAALEQAEMERRRKQALELNDEIVQGLAVAKMAFETGNEVQGLEAVSATLHRAQEIVSRLLPDLKGIGSPETGDLTRERPIEVNEETRGDDE